MSTTTVLDPAAAVRALSAELHDQLRQLLDTTRRGDPALLDKIRELSSGLGRRLTTARKRAEQPAPKPPAEPKAKDNPEPKQTPKPSSTPARIRPSTPGRSTTVPIRPASPAPARGRHRATAPATRPPRTTAPVVYRPTRHLRRLPWLLVLALLVLVGAAAAVITSQPLAGIAGSTAALGWLLLTRTRVRPPVTRQAAVVIVAGVLAVTLLTVAVASGRTDSPPYSPTAPPEVTVIGTAP